MTELNPDALPDLVEALVDLIECWPKDSVPAGPVCVKAANALTKARTPATPDPTAQIVAWLRIPRGSMQFIANSLADAIERGEHLQQGTTNV